MGSIINGKWVGDDSALIKENGYRRPLASHGGEIHERVIESIMSDDGRFHLVVSKSCPWSHRVLITVRLKYLENRIPIKIASGERIEGYPVNENRPWRLPGTKHDIIYVHEIYTIADRRYSGQASVPLLWDSLDKKVVSNESSQLIRAFDRLKNPSPENDYLLCPLDMEPEINTLNKQIFDRLANGVYRAGLAQNQKNYDTAVSDVFGMMDLLETRLSNQRFLFGNQLTLSDVVLFPVLVRFDIAYHSLFCCTRRRLVDYPVLWAYARDLFGLVPFAQDIDFSAVQKGYYLNDGECNPYKIISDLPDCNWAEPHQRDSLGALVVLRRDGEVCNAEALNQSSDKNQSTDQ